MAHIVIYDATDLDKSQLTEALDASGHSWDFIDDDLHEGNYHPEAEAIAVFISSEVTRQAIEAMPKLKLIACRSTGFNNVDFDAAKEHGVSVANVPTYGEETVAEFAFTMLLALTRKLQEVLKAEHEQLTPDQLTGRDLKGKTIGVIGTGHIGQKSLKIADGFSMNSIAFDAFPKEELQEKYNFKYVELDELIKQSDVISLHVPLLPQTRHIINRERIAQMKPGAILMNTARGELVETEALIEYLNNGHLGGVGIDVIEGEELLDLSEEMAILMNKANSRGTMKQSVQISVLKEMDNVIISPHNAYNTVEAIRRINNTSAQNIVEFFKGNPVNTVEPPKKPRGKLLIVRHGESEWNATGKWTGLTDVHLSEKGFKEAAKLGVALKDLDFSIDVAYCSEQIRSRETLEGMLNASQQFEVEVITASAINERDYGDYTGKNKWEVKEQIGEEAFNDLRRGWDVPVPNGETLKMVYERAVPFYKETIVPVLEKGQNVLIAAHGNSIRALIKYIESISDEDIKQVSMIFGQILIYDVDEKGLKKDFKLVEIDTEVSPKA
ncbi:MAG: 2,3-bisphosphoglycerate-dependent phosphoglycerate mutase [Candidatus Saccharimonadales bacterium]|nr:2,3-bisphosphoglycerate-dependent phosphoglycerate mutase [Candidatus Saccharimonadales bacterium]